MAQNTSPARAVGRRLAQAFYPASLRKAFVLVAVSAVAGNTYAKDEHTQSARMETRPTSLARLKI
jgi:hypothetical protein